MKGTPLYRKESASAISTLCVEGGMTRMNRMSIGIVLMSFVYVVGAAGCASEQTARQPTSVSPSVSPAMTEPVSVGPSDSLKACLAKISDDSSNGVRKIAEQSCQDNEKLHQ